LFSFTSIPAFHQHLREGRTTCTEAVAHYLERISAEKRLNAFVEVFADEARERAAQLDRTQDWGPLHGVVIGIKDNILYADHEAGAASKMLKGFRSLFSSTAVERLLSAGAIIIGRQNCDEFGMGSTNENSPYGPVLNPVDDRFVAGGSSGGSAAAVKAGLCMASLGSDTGGSVRLPASFCGTAGFKPGYGSISRHGLIAYGSSFDQIGILSKDVADIEVIYRVIAGEDSWDSTVSVLTEAPAANEVSKKRIAYFPEWTEHPSLDPEIAGSMEKMIEQLKDGGHTVEPASFSLTPFIVPVYYILTTAEASSNLSRYDGARFSHQSAQPASSLTEFFRQNRTEGFGREVKKRIMLGSFVLSTGYFDAYFTKAQQVRRLLADQTHTLFQKYDYIIAPIAPGTAYELGSSYKDPLAIYAGDIFTVYANLVGIPAISLPVFKHSSNLPFGLQVLSSPQNEVSLLRFSHQLMQQ